MPAMALVLALVALLLLLLLLPAPVVTTFFLFNAETAGDEEAEEGTSQAPGWSGLTEETESMVAVVVELWPVVIDVVVVEWLDEGL